MKHYFSGKVRGVLIAAVVLAVALAVVSSLTSFNLPQMLVQGVLAPIRTGASKLTDQAEQIYSYIFRYEALQAENEALRRQLAEMEDNARRADSEARENARLRKLTELLDANEDFSVMDAYIIGWSSNDWSSTITVNRGTSHGVEAGMCAITENGEMIGLITEAGTNYAVIKTILDPSLEISATIAASGYNGMVQGNYIAGQQDLLRMQYLRTDAVIRNQDQVVTTGSTVYPRNLIIGHVVDAGFDDSGVAKFALLKPAADIATLEQVFILVNYEGR